MDNKINIAFVDPKQDFPIFITTTMKKAVSEISKTNEVSFVPISADNKIIVMFNQFPEKTNDEYNFTLSFLELFGKVGFIQIEPDSIGSFNPISIDETTEKELSRIINRQKNIEKENGKYQKVIDRIKDIGRDAFLAEIRERLNMMNKSIEEEYNELNLNHATGNSLMESLIANLANNKDTQETAVNLDGLLSMMIENIHSLQNMMVNPADKKLIDNFVNTFLESENK